MRVCKVFFVFCYKRRVRQLLEHVPHKFAGLAVAPTTLPVQETLQDA